MTLMTGVGSATSSSPASTAPPPLTTTLKPPPPTQDPFQDSDIIHVSNNLLSQVESLQI